jgi:hypothetical protein
MKFALLRVNYVNQVGFHGLGYGKDILVPFKEQASPMEKGNAIWFICT